MKFNFNHDINGFQEALKLKMLLEHHNYVDVVDKSTQSFIDTLIEELKEFIASPEFEQFSHSTPPSETEYDPMDEGLGPFGMIYAYWRKLTGPTKREMILSRQRHELIRRAEHAEAISFEAIAETSAVGRERDTLSARLKELEKGSD